MFLHFYENLETFFRKSHGKATVQDRAACLVGKRLADRHFERAFPRSAAMSETLVMVAERLMRSRERSAAIHHWTRCTIPRNAYSWVSPVARTLDERQSVLPYVDERNERFDPDAMEAFARTVLSMGQMFHGHPELEDPLTRTSYSREGDRVVLKWERRAEDGSLEMAEFWVTCEGGRYVGHYHHTEIFPGSVLIPGFDAMLKNTFDFG